MSQLLRSEAVQVGTRLYTIRVLPFSQARKLLPIVHDMLATYDPELESKEALLLSAISGRVSPSAFDAMVAAFGPATTVDMGDGTGDRPSRVIQLSTDAERDQVFTGCPEEMFVWLEACVRLNFGGHIEKSLAALASLAAKVKPKMEAAARSLRE
jgi:hypothetical protein